ncbi:unnamed protein product [Cyclocybe aegerita]|uniref:G domain-containing protein n=1 Tax=Cyclocybe aegerita TaxID=1973307 RepID=A0A8S0X085_CYCAE|nr:unnamed protein product [Cyclocybe aegerita]
MLTPQSPKSIVVLLMGCTGAGKSHFINTAFGHNVALVSESQISTSLEIKHYPLSTSQHPHLSLVLVDTPGLDHISASDSAILKVIVKRLRELCSSTASFGGIIYLHDITQARLSASSSLMSYIRSPEPAGHLLLTTTKWDRDRYSPDARALTLKREDELRRGIWKRVSLLGEPSTLLALEPLKIEEIVIELERICQPTSKPTFQKRKKGIFSALFRLWNK